MHKDSTYKYKKPSTVRYEVETTALSVSVIITHCLLCTTVVILQLVSSSLL